MAKKKISKTWTTVTPLSKFLAMALFIILPFVGFYLGVQYEKKVTPSYPPTHYVPSGKAPMNATASQVVSNGETCGGTANKYCTDGYECLLNSTYPDALGKCVKQPETVSTIPSPLPANSKQSLCTMEAKQCPNGSYVGRTGPHCEFPACPK
jgi:hypothetical protein